jgi:hypothetical protein
MPPTGHATARWSVSQDVTLRCVSWLTDRLAALVAPWTALPDLRGDVRRHEHAIVNLRSDLVTTADNLVSRLNAATDELASDLSAVRDALAAAVAGQGAAVEAAVSAELAKLDAPIARLESLGQDEADPVPADEPAPVEEPAPADEPAAPSEPDAPQPEQVDADNNPPAV